MLVFLTKLVGSPFLTQQLLRRVVLFYGKMKINPHTFRRSHEDMLELQELSLHHDLPNNVMKISFGGSAIVDCQIAETPENIVCLVCTSHGASQLMFPHPRVYRSCFVALDLLEVLPKTFGLDSTYDPSASHSMFAPGLCHRLSSYPASDRGITLVVYMSMCLSSSNSISFDTTPSEEVNSSYWCWMHLDINKALSRNRESLSVLRVEPLFQPSWGNNAELWPHKSGLNMLPKMKRPDVSVLDFIPSQVIQRPGCLDDSSESRKKHKKALGGIWWIAHQTNAEDTEMDSNYFVRWTEIQNPDCDTKKRRGTISAFPPGVNLLEPVPSWYKHPTYLTQSSDDSPTDNLWDESSVDVQLHIFLDQLFHPGCLSWFAIANAFKSLCESYSLLDCDSVFTVSNLHEMRIFIHRTLLDKLIPNLDHAGFKTMLKTFYATAIDYHEHGLQPLGLLRLGTADTTTTTNGSSTSEKMFPNEDDTVIVIRRWGFSVLRHLQDVEILLWNNAPPLINRMQSPHLDTKVNTQNIVDLTTDCRKILHILQAQPQWPHRKANLFDRTKSNLNVSPLVLVEQIIEELDQINECWLPPPIISSVKFKSPFCTGSLSNSHLTAVMYLLSLLDNCDIMNKSVQPLQSLFDMDTNSTYEDMEITNQSWYNNSRSMGERSSFIPTNGQTIDKETKKFTKNLSNSCVQFVRLSLAQSTETRILFSFALLILIRRNELASNGLIMLRNNNNNADEDDIEDDDCSTDKQPKGIDINWHSNAKNRLVSLIQSLGFLHNLTVVRVRPTPDMDKLSIIRDHLNILGIHDILFPIERLNISSTTAHLSVSPVNQTPGMTIFDQIWLNWDWLKLCSTSKTYISSPSFSSWSEFSDYVLSEFSRLLSPTVDGGQGIVYVLWLLLWCGHSNEVIKLCMLLLPPTRSARMVENATKQFVGDINNNNQEHRSWQLLFSSPDLINTNEDGELWQSQNFDNDTSDYDDDNNNDGSSGRISWWWEKDFSFVHLCIGLAKLWSGESGSAKKHFVTASNWLYCYTQLFMNYLTESSVHHSNSTINQNVPKLLMPILFPKEFSLSKLFSLNESTVNGDGNSRNTNELSMYSLSPVEVQIRFLMKLMSVFEVSNYVPEILDLAEFCLNRLAETQNSIKSENCLNQNSGGRSTHRLASVLASLRGIMENDNLSGFLCGSVKKYPDFIENECSVNDNDPQSRINTRLADLEATLWTRMFKHELVLGNYTKAYMILQSNPDIARRRDCLRQLIVTVCDRGEASKLISFQYGPMENEFIAILEARARAADVVIVPDPSTKKSVSSSPAGSNPYYDVLYAYHIHRADYRAAASVMFEHSYRLIEDTMLAASRLSNFRSGGARILIGLQRQAACLASAINTLYLVPKDNQWLVCIGPYPNDDWAFANPDDLVLDNIIDEEHTSDQHNFEDNSLDQEQPISSAKRNATTIDPSLPRLGKDKRILTLEDLLNAYILTRARLRLAQACWEQGMLRAGVFTPDEVVRGLLSVALYDEAVRLCESYDLDPALIINSISLRCSELAQCATGSVNLVNFSQPTVNYELRRKEVYDIHRTTSVITTGLNQFPVLPGLANDSSPLEHEADLVQQSLSNLSTLNFDKVGNDGDNIGAIEKSSSLKIVPYHSNYNYSSRCNLPEMYWRLLETVLTRLDPPSTTNEKQSTFQTKYHGFLHLIACENILASGPNQLYLPEWLTSRLLSTSYATERAVNLLRLYIKFNRLETAYRLAMDMLEAAMNKGADPSSFGLRSTLLSNSMDPTNPIRKANKTMTISGTMYLPHTSFIYILNALKVLSPESKTCEAMHDNLESALRNYFVKLQSVCRGLITH
uniref:Nuclear pore complex protein Nup160 n=1 Tax=Schistosoma haematobium TaxID=6185 RepID=A0A095BUH3_SCHHA